MDFSPKKKKQEKKTLFGKNRMVRTKPKHFG
jgi:hypothetical protein